MDDGFIGRLDLAVSLGICHCSEASLAAQVTEVVCELAGIKLSTVVKIYGMRDAKAGDDVPLNESGGYGCHSLDLDPLGKVIQHHEEVIALSSSLLKRSEDVHSPCGKWEGADYQCHSSGGDSLDGRQLLAFVTGPH